MSCSDEQLAHMRQHVAEEAGRAAFSNEMRRQLDMILAQGAPGDIGTQEPPPSENSPRPPVRVVRRPRAALTPMESVGIANAQDHLIIIRDDVYYNPRTGRLVEPVAGTFQREEVASSLQEYDRALDEYNRDYVKYQKELLDYYHRIMREMILVGDSLWMCGIRDLPYPYFLLSAHLRLIFVEFPGWVKLAAVVVWWQAEQGEETALEAG